LILVGTAVADQFDVEICKSVDHTLQCCDPRQRDVQLVSISPFRFNTLLEAMLIYD
jgi:hypothetical protein